MHVNSNLVSMDTELAASGVQEGAETKTEKCIDLQRERSLLVFKNKLSIYFSCKMVVV